MRGFGVLPGFTPIPITITAPPSGGGATGVGYADQVGNGVPVGVVQVLIAALDAAAAREGASARPDLQPPTRYLRALLAAVSAPSRLNADGLVTSSLVREILVLPADDTQRHDIRFFVQAAAPNVDFQRIVDQIDAGYYLGSRARQAQADADAAAARAQAAADAAATAQREADAQAAAQAAAQAEQARQEALAAQHHADQLAADQEASRTGMFVVGGLLAVLALGAIGVVAWRSR